MVGDIDIYRINIVSESYGRAQNSRASVQFKSMTLICRGALVGKEAKPEFAQPMWSGHTGRRFIE